MDINELTQQAARVMTLDVLRRVEDAIKELKPDVSATASQHVLGYEAGFRAAKRAMLEMLAD